jgi:hypothetical protein
MNPYTQACLPDQRLSKNTLLALLPSKLDTSRVIVVGTTQVIDISNLPAETVNSHLNDGSWTYYETLLPRRMLVENSNWTITSFNPKSRNVCVNIVAPSGVRYLNFTVSELAPKF